MRSRPRAREPYIRCTQGAQNHPDHYECERAKQVGPDRREDRNRPRPRSPNFQIAGVALRPRSRWPRRSCCPLDGQSNPFLCDGLPALHARDRHHRANLGKRTGKKTTASRIYVVRGCDYRRNSSYRFYRLAAATLTWRLDFLIQPIEDCRDCAGQGCTCCRSSLNSALASIVAGDT